MVGQTISHYKIIEKLGEGGMGVVYKAQDLKLKRTVALKFLPHHLTATTDEQARFLQEARAASALNHPNICGIHSIGEDGDKQFIEMEFVDGKTLRQLVPIQKTQIVIDYAIQIGEALQEAHSKGIVHRDVKAENVMVNSKNQIKVMDFGLAKLKGSLKLTKTSSTVGTLAYMAPEQIQGGEVDARSDIFSFGVLLFEMLTGYLPFRGEHDAAMMYSIVNEQPEPIEKYLPEASLEFLHIFNRALEKDPEDRYQTVHDMVIDLRRLKKETSRVSREFAVSSGNLPPMAHDVKSMSIKKVHLGIGAVAVFAIAALFFFWPRSTGELNPDRKTTPLDLPFTEIGYAGLSPDGRFLAFPAADANGKWDIYSMHILDQVPKRITFDSASLPFGWTVGARISPDSRLIAYGRFNKATRQMDGCVVPLVGATSKVVIDGGGSSRWRPDGERLGYVVLPSQAKGKFEFWTVSPKGTDREMVFRDTAGFPGRFSFAWSPDGESIAWLRTYPGNYQEIIVRALASGQERQLTYDKKHMDEVWWSENNQILYSSNKAGSTNIWTVPSTGGKPVPITTGEGPDCGITMSADCKKLVYSRIKSIGYLWRASTDGSRARQLTSESRANGEPNFSPDRKQIVYSGFPDELSNNSGIYIVDREGQHPRELIPPTAFNGYPTWSPDGRWVAYRSRLLSTPADSATISIIDPNSMKIRRLLANGSPRSWSNSNTLVFMRGMQYWEANILTGEQRPTLEDSTFAVRVMGGRYLCYTDRRAITEGLWITPSQNTPDFHRVQSKLLAPREELGDYNILTAREAFALLYDDNGAIQKVSFPTGTRERIRGTFPGLKKSSFVSVSYDGKEMVYVQNRLDSKLVMIEDLFK